MESSHKFSAQKIKFDFFLTFYARVHTVHSFPYETNIRDSNYTLDLAFSIIFQEHRKDKEH